MNGYHYGVGRRTVQLVVVLGLVTALTSLLTEAAEASHGSTGSIVYTNGPTRTDDTIGGDIWIMSPDGSTKVRITSNANTPDPDGMGDKPYFLPSQTDSGDIVAVRNQLQADGSIRSFLWVMNRSGVVLSKFAPPQTPFRGPAGCNDFSDLPMGITHAAVSPDGARIAYTERWLYRAWDCGINERTALRVIDRSNTNPQLISLDYVHPSWASNSRLLVAGNGVRFVDLPSTTGNLWFNTDAINLPVLKNGKLATTAFASSWSSGELHLWSANGGPPTAPTPRCRLIDPVGNFFSPTWAPGGSALAWWESDSDLATNISGEGIWAMSVGDIATTCPTRANAHLIAPGGSWPSWGPAPVPIAPPTLAVNDVTVTEGNSGTRLATFTITRSGSTTAASSVTAATIDGTATAPADYVALTPTTVNFAAADTTPKTVSVTINGDTTVEPNETFSVKLTSPSGATIADDTGVGTITNDDVPPAQNFTYTVGSTVSNGVPAPGAGNIETPGAVDTYSFSGAAGQKVFVDYLTSSTCGLNWRLIGPANATVFASRGICGDPGQFSLPTAGTYTLTVDTAAGSTTVGTYSFRITDVPVAQSFAYTVGNTVSNSVPTAGAGNIETPGAVDVYTFTGTAGQKVFVDYLTSSTCGLNWRLIGPANATVFAPRGICGDPGQFSLPTAGTYTLTVDTPTTSAVIGTYSFRITEVPSAQTFPYTVGDMVSNGVPATGAGNIETPGAVDIYTFTGTAGQKVFVDYLTASACGLNWRLLGPSNAPVFASRGICSDPGQLILSTAGTYTLTVDTPVTSAATGTYSFRITNVPGPQSFSYGISTTVSNGVPATGAGNIETPGAVDIYTFTGTAGQKVFVDYLTASACGLNWRLLGPSNAPVFASRGICSDPGQLILSTAGTYTLTVDTPATSAATGTYSFRITNVPGPQSFSYGMGTTVSNGVPATGAGNIETPGAVDIYTFTGTAGQKVFVDYLTASACGLNWRLLGPSNAPVFASRGICSDPGQLILSTAGTYTLTVDTPATSAATGTYSFRITNVPGPQSFSYGMGTTVSNGVPATGAGNIETPGAVDIYTFSAPAGQKVFVDYLTANTCALNWRLTGPSNTPVFAARGICSDPGQFVLPAAGTYTLTVDTPVTSAATGTYSFRITNVPASQTFAYTLGSTVSNGVPAAGAGNIEAPGAVDMYTFSGASGQKVFVDYLTASTCGLNWRLIGPANATVFASRGICADPGQFTLPAAGTYILTVDTSTTSAAVGTYSFQVTNVA